MATGLQGTTGNVNTIQLIAGATSANTVATSSVTISSTPTDAQYYDLRAYRAQVGFAPNTGTIIIRSTAGSGTMTLASARVMIADEASGIGGPLGVGADASKGMLNNGGAFGETATDYLYHREVISGLATADGIQIQLGVIGGTATAIRVELLLPAYNQAAA